MISASPFLHAINGSAERSTSRPLQGDGWERTHHTAPLADNQAGSADTLVTDAQTTQLLSLAFGNAIRALNESDPETWLRMRSCNARAGMRDVFASLSHQQACDPAVARDFRMAVVSQNLALELALEIVNSVKRYEAARENDSAPIGRSHKRPCQRGSN